MSDHISLTLPGWQLLGQMIVKSTPLKQRQPLIQDTGQYRTG